MGDLERLLSQPVSNIYHLYVAPVIYPVLINVWTCRVYKIMAGGLYDISDFALLSASYFKIYQFIVYGSIPNICGST